MILVAIFSVFSVVLEFELLGLTDRLLRVTAPTGIGRQRTVLATTPAVVARLSMARDGSAGGVDGAWWCLGLPGGVTAMWFSLVRENFNLPHGLEKVKRLSCKSLLDRIGGCGG